ncbi:hypothetical protein ABMY11_21620 [Vibrio vulnificus]|uniref:hypothetical protein n=1 Tax=Vibrio vulnificus TaxID=672 RepID=UPI00405867CC
MTKNYWVKAAKFKQAQMQVVQEESHQGVDAHLEMEPIFLSGTPQQNIDSTFCEEDRILSDFLNDFRRLRTELQSLSAADYSAEDNLKIIS